MSALPAGPSSPWWWQLGRLIADPIGFLKFCQSQWGDRFTLRLLGSGSPPLVFLSNPDDVGEVFGKAAAALEFGKVTQVFLPLVGSQSLIMQQGDRHLRQRQLIMPAFLRESLARQSELIAQVTRQQMASWSVGDAIDIRAEMSQVSLRVILEVVFGLVPGVRYERLRSLLSVLLDQITDPLYSVQFFLPPLQNNFAPWSPWGKFQALMAEIDALVYAEIHDRRSIPNPKSDPSDRSDVLSILMAAQDEDGLGMPDTELRDNLMTLLLLGHETTASSLAWAFYWVHCNPEILERLRSEVSPVLEDAVLLGEQPFLGAVCQESLRICPIALIAQPRRVKDHVQVGNIIYAPGTVLIPCVLTAQGRVETYGDPEVFRPDRFLERKFGRGEFFPFGGGSRSCVGMALSMLEMKVVLATVLGGCEFESNLMEPVKAVRRGITFVPPDRFRLTMKRVLATK